MKTKKRRYKGELAKPIHVGSIPIETTNEEQAEIEQRLIEQAIIEKLPLLMEHYGIADADDYFSLAVALAVNHVPRLRVVPAKLRLEHGNWGAAIKDRRTEWPRERLLSLLDAVEKAKQRPGSELSTDREAIRSIMGKPDWHPRRPTADLDKWLETLESRLQDAKRIKRVERDGGAALDPASASIVRELEEEVAHLATETISAAIVYATLPTELRFAALCLPLFIEQNSGNSRD